MDQAHDEASGLRRRLAEAEARIAELVERDTHLRLAMEASRVVAYQWDIGRDRITRLRSGTQPGTPLEDAGGFESVVAKVLPEDQATFRADIAAALASPDGAYRTEVRYRRDDGQVRWLSESGRVLRGADGRPDRMVGITFDITERKQAEVALREAEGLLRELLDTLPVGVLIAHDSDCRRVTCNRAGARLLRIPAHENASVVASGVSEPSGYLVLRDGEPVPPEELPLRRVLAGRPVDNLEYELRFEDGTACDLLISAATLHDEGGAVRGAVATLLDVTEQKRARRALQEDDRRKTEFIATLAHELRNPLAPIRNTVEILRLRPASANDPSLHAIIERQLRHMVRLVDDLLDVSRITRGRLELRRERFALESLVAQAVESARPAIEREGHALEMRLRDGETPLDGDPVRLVQALVNLLTNAAKYTPRGGRIELRAGVERGEARIAVRDSGIGMAPEHLARAFDMFWQAGGSASQGGLGIGLSLARSIARMHGGSLEGRSDGPGRGAEFELRLPVAPSAVPAPASA